VWGIRKAPLPQAYFPLTMALGPGMGAHLVVKTLHSPQNSIESIRQIIKGLDSSLALLRPRTMDEVVADAMQDTSLQTTLLAVFAGLATLLAALGLFSVMAYMVSMRTRELGIRMALGAQQLDILRLVMGHGARLTLIGIGAGLLAALALSRLLRNLLYEVSAYDTITLASVSLLLALVALAACYIPVRRAARTDPMIALRYE
jgi:putative ABC transport system permease protein